MMFVFFVLQTEYDGQIKEFFKLLERRHVDGVVVAGGNGSLLEVIILVPCWR